MDFSALHSEDYSYALLVREVINMKIGCLSVQTVIGSIRPFQIRSWKAKSSIVI